MVEAALMKEALYGKFASSLVTAKFNGGKIDIHTPVNEMGCGLTHYISSHTACTYFHTLPVCTPTHHRYVLPHTAGMYSHTLPVRTPTHCQYVLPHTTCTYSHTLPVCTPTHYLYVLPHTAGMYVLPHTAGTYVLPHTAGMYSHTHTHNVASKHPRTVLSNLVDFHAS